MPSAGNEAIRGRDAEQRTVRGLLRQTERGLGGVLLVEGELGIGKSLLLRESEREAAGHGFSLAAGAADRLSRAIPFWGLQAALHELFGRLNDGNSHHDHAETLTWWIGQARAQLEGRAAAAPVLVSVDDLQWASPDTLAALRTLPRDLKRHPVAWLLARSHTGQQDAEYLFSALANEGATRITLAPLDDEAVAGLLMDAFGAPPDGSLLALAAGAAGNPSLLTELICGLRDMNAVQVTDGRARLTSAELPCGLHRAAQQRLDGLSKRARHLLVTATVLGRTFRLEDAAELLGETPAALLPAIEEAMSAGIITVTGDGFTFRHALLHRALSDTLPHPARKALHRQYADILLNRGESAHLAAGHLLQAAHPSDPASLAGLDSAAAQTLPLTPHIAADLTLRALELTPVADRAALTRSVTAAEALTAAGRLEEASRVIHDALARPLPAIAEARLRCALSSILCASGQAGSASAEAETVRGQGQLPRDLHSQAMTAQLQALAGSRGQAARGIADTILAAPDDYSDPAIAAARVAHAMINWQRGQLGGALELLREAARQGTGLSSDARQFQPMLVLAACLVDLRQLGQAEELLRVADTQPLHGIPSQAVLPILRARISLANGRLSDAAAEGETALAASLTLTAHAYTSAAHCVLAVIALRRGDIAAAAQHVANCAVRMPHIAGIYARTESTVAEAQITEARDGAAAAIGHMRHFCADLPADRALFLGEPAASAWLVRTALAAGDDHLASRAARSASALARDNDAFPAITAAAAHSLGLLHEDPARLAQAAAQHTDPWARASAAEDLGVLQAGRGDRRQAIHNLSQALLGYQPTGAATDMARIRRRLRKLGVRRRHWSQSADRPVTGWGSLTDAEHATSELVAQGLNNQQVADRMYVSVHTVAFHLRQIFRKLSIGSRVELARMVFERANNSANPRS
jgi:DNA-binding CsgD family transcriptional regulator